MISTRRRDWFYILRCLAGQRITYADVARKCNRDACTVRNWADGGEPRESDARLVLALFAKYCPALYLEHQKEFEIVPGHTDGEAAKAEGAAPKRARAADPFFHAIYSNLGEPNKGS